MVAEEKIKQITEVLDQLADDVSVPRNIRKGAQEAKSMLLKKDDPLDMRTASANSKLDDLANDPNIPMHARTLIWSIMSQLESVKT
ncbi:MAG: UPF0147 family protein [Thermoplasmatales archaeon]|nr:UPF0147 family protein [Thermoplasmatales archaeon]